MANSTMNSTISSVIMSAYVSSHRSWLTCSSCSSWRFFRADMTASGRLRLVDGVALLGSQVGEQLLLDDPRVGAGLDGEDALDDQLAMVGLDLADPLELVAHGQPHDVGRHDTPEGGDERA